MLADFQTAVEGLCLHGQTISIEDQTLRVHFRDAQTGSHMDKGREFVKIRFQRGKPQRYTWCLVPSLLLQGYEGSHIARDACKLINAAQAAVRFWRGSIH